MPLGTLKNYTGPLLLGHLDTSNLLLINVIYHRPTAASKWNDYCSIIVKDVRTGEKKLITLENPPMLMYVVKDEYRNYSFTPAYRPLEQCNVKKILYKDVLKEIREVGGDPAKEFWNACIAQQNRRALKNLHKYPYVLGTDVNYAALLS